MSKAIVVCALLAFALSAPAAAWETVIGRWCDVVLPSMPQVDREIIIEVDATGAIYLHSLFGNGVELKHPLTDAGGQVYLTGNDYGERYRIVGSTGELELIDNEGLIRVARRLGNVARKGDCLP